jgi:hypothetical protein
MKQSLLILFCALCWINVNALEPVVELGQPNQIDFIAQDATQEDVPPVVIECIVYNPEGIDEEYESIEFVANVTTEMSGWYFIYAESIVFSLDGVRPFREGSSITISNLYEPMYPDDGGVVRLFDPEDNLVDEFEYVGGGNKECREDIPE